MPELPPKKLDYGAQPRTHSPLDERNDAIISKFTHAELRNRFTNAYARARKYGDWGELNKACRIKLDALHRFQDDGRFVDLTRGMIRNIVINTVDPETHLQRALRELRKITAAYPSMRAGTVRTLVRNGTLNALDRAKSLFIKKRSRPSALRESHIRLDAQRNRDGGGSTKHEAIAASGSEQSAAKVEFENILHSGILSTEERRALSTYLDNPGPTEAETLRVAAMLKKHQVLVQRLATRLQRFEDTGL